MDTPATFEFSQFILWAFYAVVGGGIFWCAKTLSSMNKSIIQLNNSVAVILEKMSWHEKEIEKINNRLTRFETKHHN